LGLEGDLLDALVLGPRRAYGARARLPAWAAITLRDRGLCDDKLVCCEQRPSAAQLRSVLAFFHAYARCKALLNLMRRRPGRNACEGWRSASSALARARPLNGAPPPQPTIPF
jgi:inorganic pyrophosphatase